MTVHVPTSLAEATELLAANPDARVLAGGTDTMVEVNFNRFKPTNVIALRRVAELERWSIEGDLVTIGATVPYSRLERGEIAGLFPALAAAARTVGSPQIRAAGTLGGNLGTCSPAGDGLPVLAALDATINLRSTSGVRSVPFRDFMVGPKRNSANPDELIESVTMRRTQGFQDYAKVGVRNAMVISVAGVCFVHDTTTASVRVGLGSVGPTIIRATEAEAWLASHVDLSSSIRIAEDAADRFASMVADAARPITDHRSTADYRRHAVRTLAKRLVLRSAQ